MEQILVLDTKTDEVAAALHNIVHQLPEVSITKVETLEKYEKVVNDTDFDVVILDYDISGMRGVEMIHELKLKDYEPVVLIVSTSVEDPIFTEIYNHGSHRYIVKKGPWKDEIGPAVRHLLRIRRLEAENRSLLAKLTEANAMLNDKNRRLDEFSATLAHDIRGPLGGICMKLEYVLDTYGSQFDERLWGLLDRARQASDRLTHIVQAMYDFAKLGNKAAKMEYVPMEAIVNGVISDLSFDESLNFTIGVGEMPQVWGNKELLSRIFMNLISNAVKYCDKEEIIVNIGTRRIEEKTLGKFVEIFVEDNGPGISGEDQREIFHIFNRGVAQHSNKEGLGLGLSVVQRIVELHFGKVWIESKVGEGTTFIVSLPIDEISFAR